MKPIHLRVPWLSGIQAITLWPFCLYRGAAYNDPCIRVHELWHWYDCKRWFVLPWYLAYGILALEVLIRRWPVDRHRLERQAYKLERECREQK